MWRTLQVRLLLLSIVCRHSLQARWRLHSTDAQAAQTFQGLLQGIYAYCTLTANTEPSDELKKELVLSVRSQIGAFAAPDVIHWAPGLPKTRSGKIMRRVLR